MRVMWLLIMNMDSEKKNLTLPKLENIIKLHYIYSCI